MNSQTKEQESWKTSDGSAWWLRSSKAGSPSGDYHANCYLGISSGSTADAINFNDHDCNYHSKSYYCQPLKLSLIPKKGSPAECACHKVALVGKYSAESLIKCENCLDVYKSLDKNSCPSGTKIFSPRTRDDWKTILASVKPLRSPHWIIDITR